MNVNELDDCERIDPRDARALTECMTVMEEIGRARGADGLYLVVTESGEEYLVDLVERACECPDFEYNLPDDDRHACKHIARATYESGSRPIPAWVDRSALDDQLVAAEHVSGNPRAGRGAVAADGGADLEADEDAEADDRGEDDADDVETPRADCWCSSHDLPCFDHFEGGDA